MKTYIYKIKFCIIVLCLLFLHSCNSDESLISEIRSTIPSGAILRTIKLNNPTFNFFDTSSKWSVTLEEQDATNGSLFLEIKLYATHTTNGITSSEKFVKSIPASTFSMGPNGYPRGEVSATLSEVLTKLGIVSGGYTSSDKINMRLELVLNDGRTFTNDAGATITGGSYFASPFEYSVQFFCPLANAADFNGNYKVTADAWADYGVGDIVPVVYNPADGLYTFRIMNINNPYVVNSSTSYIIVTITPADANVKITSNEAWNYGGGFITTVTGSGSVGSCTGDINLKLNFSGSSQNQTFTLVKAP